MIIGIAQAIFTEGLGSFIVIKKKKTRRHDMVPDLAFSPLVRLSDAAIQVLEKRLGISRPGNKPCGNFPWGTSG